MITRVSALTPINNNYKYNRNISFKGYKTISEDIDIYSENVDSPISSMSGDIGVDSSKINKSVSNMSGDIVVDSSKVIGSVSNMSGDIDVSASNISGNINDISGDIEINNNSVVNGNISNKTGSVSIKESMVLGDSSNIVGKTLVRNSIVEGSIFTTPENLQLKGRNRIKELVLKGFKRVTDYANSYISELKKNGYIIRNNDQIFITDDNQMQILVSNKNSQYVSSNSPLEFRLPKGSVIDTIRFVADKPGVLIVEDGSEFSGNLVNGTIKGKNTNSRVHISLPKPEETKQSDIPSVKEKKVNEQKPVSPDRSSDTVKISFKPEKVRKLNKQSSEAKKVSDDIMREQFCEPTDKSLSFSVSPEVEHERFPQLNWNEIPIESDATDFPGKEIKYSSTFRDEELFDYAEDSLSTPRLLQYSVDDVPIRENLWMKYSESVGKYNHRCGKIYPEIYCDEDILNSEVVQTPWKNPQKGKVNDINFKIFMLSAREKIKEITPDYGMMMNKIFKNCTVLRNGENKQDLDLCKLALKLFINSEKWGKVEEQIIDEVKIPIYGKVYGAISYVKFNMANKLLIGRTNQSILNCLKSISPADVFNLRSLF